jgi:type I restriction enzyme S subunit
MNNLVPDGWSFQSINDVANIFAGGTPSRSNPEYYNGNIPWVKSGEVNARQIYNTSEKISALAVKESSARMAPSGSVLLAMYGATAGQVAELMVDATLNQAVSAINSKSNLAHNRYLIYILEFNKEELLNTAQGSGQPNLSGQLIKSFKVSFPPLPEQQKIAKILTSVDEVIEKTQAKIDKLKDLKTGMMQELLTNGIGHTEFKDSPVGRIPFDWDVVTIDGCNVKVLDGDRGKEYPKEKDFLEHGYCLFLSAKNVTKSGFSFDRRVYLTKEKDELLRKGKLKRDDLVITTRGTLGNIAYFDEKTPYEHIRINSGMAIIRNESTKVTTPYLHLLLNSPVIIEQTELLAFGSAIPQLTIALLKNLHLPIPSKDEQLVIVDTIQAVSSKISLLNRKLVAIKDTKKALMQDLLTGKVRVKTESTNTEVAMG